MIKVLCRLLELGKILTQHRSVYGKNVTSGKHQQGSHSVENVLIVDTQIHV